MGGSDKVLSIKTTLDGMDAAFLMLRMTGTERLAACRSTGRGGWARST
jgi:hypothetical protein